MLDRERVRGDALRGGACGEPGLGLEVGALVCIGVGARDTPAEPDFGLVLCDAGPLDCASAGGAGGSGGVARRGC